MRTLWQVVGTGMAAMSLWVGAAAAETEYRIPALGDYTGPFADLTKQLASREAVVKWWNDNEGKKLGIKLTVKNYDTRYDSTVVASMWPGILSDLKPIVALGLGGADVAALQQRLPKDKVPVVYAPPAYGYGWLPNQWIFGPRATYTHEWATALRWFIDNNPTKKPIKVAFMTSQSAAATLDLKNGIEKYIKTVLEPKGLATVVATEWIEMQPVDVSSQMKNVVDAKADLIIGPATTSMAAAVLRAQQLHGVNIPTIAAPWHTIWPIAQAMKTFEPWEGHMVATGLVSIDERDSAAYRYYKILAKDYGLAADWNPLSLLGISQAMLAVRAVEHAAKKVGADKLTGEAVYDALATGVFTEEELMGVLPTLNFSKDAPFPIKDAKVKIEWVKGGKYQLATPQWLTIPSDVEKW